ncbi:hypothetical protein NFI95_08145 [Acetobacteraceae bacterium KSS8]|uniref:Uncharacterized protein n=1 Tax=Endosaccharibacter trunci TaxID=2812733 RepID=A0ABT1W6B5_9PROT|nr:hypothetical protein [Acetobacteraceae bacterium KSS8]
MTRSLPLLLLLLSVPLSGCMARGSDRISSVVPLDLGEGATTVQHLAPDGRQGLVVEARDPVWHAPVLMAMLPRASGARGWDVVGLENDAGARVSSLEGRGRALVLARAKVGGMPATLLFVAGPDGADTGARGEPKRMVIRTLRLQTDGDGASFDQIGVQTTRRVFCSPSEAIAMTFRTALPEGNASEDVCRASPGS